MVFPLGGIASVSSSKWLEAATHFYQNGAGVMRAATVLSRSQLLCCVMKRGSQEAEHESLAHRHCGGMEGRVSS